MTDGPSPSDAASWVYLDLDRTFSARSTEPIVTQALWRQGSFSFLQLAHVGWSYLLYEARLLPDLESAKRRAVRTMMKGLPVGPVQATVEQCLQEKLLPLVRPSLIEALQKHRAAGRRIALLTSTMDLIAEPYARHFGFDAVFATKLTTAGGTYTGGISGEFPYGETKAVIAARHARSQGVKLADCYAYGDHFKDRFLLESVGHAIAVHPDRKLRALATQNGWSIDQTS